MTSDDNNTQELKENNMSDVIFEDRYSATGTPYPDENSCDDCDAMGVYPVKLELLNAEAHASEGHRLTIIGQEDRNGEPMPDDGWVIVQCPVCKGTRRKAEL
jgi:hypothetical protein